jgi:cell division protein FtsI/penicillin-binding protein 2
MKMGRSIHARRLVFLAVMLCLVLAGLGARLVVLQVLWHEKLKRIAEWNTQSFSLREPRRGDILDVNGNPLANSVPVKRVFANPRFIGNRYPEVARVLAPLLSYNEAELVARLRPVVVRTTDQGIPVTNAAVNLKRKVSLDQWQQITQAMAQLTFDLDGKKPTRAEKSFCRTLREKAIYPIDDQQRIYPSRRLAAHVLGFVQERERETNNIIINELVGQDGIEAWFNSKLCGIRGWRVTEADNKRREIVLYREQEVEARPGYNVVLTLDMIIQHMVELELAEAMKKHSPISASALVLRPRTGEILAMATLPDYDPNQPEKAEMDHMRNRIVADMVEPGSTFKIVVVSAALNENLITLGDVFDCEHGRWRFLNRDLHDDHGGYGSLTVENIIAKSSNIGAAKIAIYRLGEQRLYEYVKSYGFGVKTGITLGGEVNGRVNKFDRDKLMISRVPMGQSVSVTHLQMAMAMAAIANSGKLMWPMVVKRLQDQNGATYIEYRPHQVRQVITESAARDIVQALKVVATKDGTAPKAALELYTVAGKTGTAQKVIDRAYAPGKYTTSFIGFFPADEPELLISVMLDEPKNGHYGGQIAAPVFKAIAEQAASYLKIHPDRPEAPTETMAGSTVRDRFSTAALNPD